MVTEKHSGQFVFTIAGLFLALLTIAIFMTSTLNGANVIQNLDNFSDSAKLMFGVVAFFLFVGAFMTLISGAGNQSYSYM